MAKSRTLETNVDKIQDCSETAASVESPKATGSMVSTFSLHNLVDISKQTTESVQVLTKTAKMHSENEKKICKVVIDKKAKKLSDNKQATTSKLLTKKQPKTSTKNVPKTTITKSTQESVTTFISSIPGDSITDMQVEMQREFQTELDKIHASIKKDAMEGKFENTPKKRGRPRKVPERINLLTMMLKHVSKKISKAETPKSVKSSKKSLLALQVNKKTEIEAPKDLSFMPLNKQAIASAIPKDVKSLEQNTNEPAVNKLSNSNSIIPVNTTISVSFSNNNNYNKQDSHFCCLPQNETALDYIWEEPNGDDAIFMEQLFSNTSDHSCHDFNIANESNTMQTLPYDRDDCVSTFQFNEEIDAPVDSNDFERIFHVLSATIAHNDVQTVTIESDLLLPFSCESFVNGLSRQEHPAPIYLD